MRGAFYYVGCNMIYPELTLTGDESKTINVTGTYLSCIVNYSTDGSLLVEAASDNGIFEEMTTAGPGEAYIGGMVIRQLRFTTTGATGQTDVHALLSFNSGFEQVVLGRLLTKGNTRDRINAAVLDFKDDTNARGLGYYSEYNQPAVSGVAPNNKTYAVFTCPADKYVVLTGREVDTNKTPLYYRVYKAWTGGTLGTPLIVRSTRNDSAFPPGVTITPLTGAVVPSALPADKVTERPYFGSIGVGGTNNGVNATTGSFRTFAPGSSFLVEWDNQSTETMYIYTALEWFELPAAIIP